MRLSSRRSIPAFILWAACGLESSNASAPDCLLSRAVDDDARWRRPPSARPTKPRSATSSAITSMPAIGATRRRSGRCSPTMPISTRRPASGGAAGPRSCLARSRRHRPTPDAAGSPSRPCGFSPRMWRLRMGRTRSAPPAGLPPDACGQPSFWSGRRARGGSARSGTWCPPPAIEPGPAGRSASTPSADRGRS